MTWESRSTTIENRLRERRPGSIGAIPSLESPRRPTSPKATVFYPRKWETARPEVPEWNASISIEVDISIRLKRSLSESPERFGGAPGDRNE